MARDVLIIEDDHSIRTALVDLLGGMGYEVISAADGEVGMQMAIARNYHLLLLDLVLPYHSGFEILEALQRDKPGQAIIIFSAMGQEQDRIKGLKLGADDYCVKPFSVRELLARIDAVLRRTHERKAVAAPCTLGAFFLDNARQTLRSEVEEITLGEKEFLIIKYLYQNSERFVSKEELLQKIWNVRSDLTDSRTAEVHIATLRKKLPPSISIMTKRGLGYQLSTIP